MINEIRLLALPAGLVGLTVLVAIMCDLVVGWRKAAERGETHTSYALARTATKIVTYFSALGVGLCIDVLLCVGKLWKLLEVEVINSVPVVMCIIAVLLCVVEAISIQETSDVKARKRLAKAGDVMVTLASKNEKLQALAQAIVTVMNEGNDKKDDGND